MLVDLVVIPEVVGRVIVAVVRIESRWSRVIFVLELAISAEAAVALLPKPAHWSIVRRRILVAVSTGVAICTAAGMHVAGSGGGPARAVIRGDAPGHLRGGRTCCLARMLLSRRSNHVTMKEDQNQIAIEGLSLATC